MTTLLPSPPVEVVKSRTTEQHVVAVAAVHNARSGPADQNQAASIRSAANTTVLQCDWQLLDRDPADIEAVGCSIVGIISSEFRAPLP